MRVPKKKKEWIVDAVTALDQAWETLASDAPDIGIPEMAKLYELGPNVCACRRGITDQNVLSKMEEYSIAAMVQDLEADPESISNYSINFLITVG